MFFSKATLSIKEQFIVHKKMVNLFKNNFLKNLEMVVKSKIGLWFEKRFSSSFLKSGITLAIFNLSGNIPVFSISLIITVIGLINAPLILFNNFDDNPSKPKLELGASLSMMWLTISSLIFLKWNMWPCLAVR